MKGVAREKRPDKSERQPPAQAQKPHQGHKQIAVDEEHDRDDIRQNGPSRSEGVKQERAYASGTDNHNKSKGKPVVRCLPAPEQKGGKCSHQKGRVGDRVQRLGPEFRPDTLAIIVHLLVQRHRPATL